MLKNETGKRYGRLVALERQRKFPGQTNARWVCMCDCGNETVVNGYNLRTSHTRSCGCLELEYRFGTRPITEKSQAYRNSRKPGFGIGPSANSYEARR